MLGVSKKTEKTDDDVEMEMLEEDENDVDETEYAKPPETELLFAKDKKEIYIRKVMKSSRKKTGQNKKGTRVYNSYNACAYCTKMVQHIPTHLKTHRDIPELSKLFDEAEKNNSHPDFNAIRARGNDSHNRQVLEKGKGELILSRRPTEAFSSKAYGPCPSCLEWMRLNTIPRHQIKCTQLKNRDKKQLKPSKRELLLKADILAGRIMGSPSRSLRDEVYTIMLRDEVSSVAQSDKLIVCLGESWLKNNIDNKTKRKYYTSQHMRAAARLLMELRKVDAEARSETETTDPPDVKSMYEYLTPANFDKVTTAALRVALPDFDDEEELKAPSNAIKIKFDIRKLVNAKWALVVKGTDFNAAEARSCEVFLQLMNVEWSEKVTKLARSILDQRKFNKDIQIPSPEDLKALTGHVTKEMIGLDLTQEAILDTFHRATVLAETRLLVYNRRRSGELEGITMLGYMSRKKSSDDVQGGILKEMSPVELQLFKSQDLMTVRGKRGRGVPVIIPQDTSAILDYLSTPSIRAAAGILPENKFLFPNSRMGYLRAYESLQKLSEESGVTTPARMTSVSLRKYTATLTQVMNLEDHQLQWLCDHLGHSKKTHLGHYRQMSGYIERVKLAKLFLLQDNNLVQRFAGKKLEDIDITDVVFGEKTDGTDNSQAEVQVEVNSGDSDDDREEPKNKKVKRTRLKWTEEEESEIHLYLEEFLRKKITPGREKCLAAKRKSVVKGGTLHRRDWHTIVKKVSAMNRK